MQRIHLDDADTSASESSSLMLTKALPRTSSEDSYAQGVSSRNEVTNSGRQQSKGPCVASTEFNLEDTIAKYRNMAVKPFTINPANYSYNW